MLYNFGVPLHRPPWEQTTKQVDNTADLARLTFNKVTLRISAGLQELRMVTSQSGMGRVSAENRHNAILL
jgi:hypothetical protein